LPSPAEIAAIRQLTNDLPALWQAPTTTGEERQTIVRLLLERVLVTVSSRTCSLPSTTATGMVTRRPIRWCARSRG
jgi:hypothetical protein